jgi:acyl-CoA reductase-like NAD-dependent aldehyde dehydrogenase
MIASVPMSSVRPLYIDGRWVSTEAASEVRSPWDGRAVAKVALASSAEMERATAAACRAFQETRRLSRRERAATRRSWPPR